VVPVRLIVFWIFTVALTPSAWAHGGGLNAEGCHIKRSTGDYHCHGSKKALPNSFGNMGGEAAKNTNSQRIPTRPFANCTAARTAGAAPIRRGEPGYGPHLDRDNDGIACEPYRGH
jgi:hypothetical protein